MNIYDVAMTYTPSNIIQSSEYYPYGLQAANSWTRDNATVNNFLYDAGNELNTTSGFYDLPFRNYDAALGRFFQVDPLSITSHNLSPYHYANNNPIAFNDPSGLEAPNPTTREEWHAYWDYVNSGYQGSYDEWSKDPGGPNGGGITTSLTYYTWVSRRPRYDKREFTNWGHWEERTREVVVQSPYLPDDRFSISFPAIRKPSMGDTGSGGSWVYKNNNQIGLTLEVIENGTSEAIQTVVVNPALYSGGAKIGAKLIGGSVIGLNVGITGYTLYKEKQDGTFNTHSYVNAGVTLLSTAATGLGILIGGGVIVVTSPVWGTGLAIGGAVLGVGYGIAQVAGIDDWIDSKWGKPKK